MSTGFWKFLKSLFSGRDSVEVSAKTVEEWIDKEELSKLSMEEFTIHAAINLIANSISKCEFRTFEEGKEKRSEEWYAWNYQPNANQNSGQFIQEIVTRLLYFNECLVVESAGQLIIAESFSKEEFALKETVFSGVSRKGFTFRRAFRMSDVLYFQLNNKNIRQLLAGVCGGYNKLLNEAVEKFEKAGGEKGTLEIDAAAMNGKYGGKTFEEVYTELMNERFKKFFNARSAVLPLWRGFTYTKQAADQSKKSTSELKDVLDMAGEVTETVARAFNIPAALLKGDVAEVDKVTKNFLTFCLDPIADMMQTEINRKRYGREAVCGGHYLRIDTTSVMHKDIFEVHESVDKLIASGMYCIDELRRKLGDAELGTDWSRAHYITKNYEEVAHADDGQEAGQAGSQEGGDGE